MNPSNTLDLPEPYPRGTHVEITSDDNDADADHVGEVGTVLGHAGQIYRVRLRSKRVVFLPFARAIAIPAEAMPD